MIRIMMMWTAEKGNNKCYNNYCGNRKGRKIFCNCYDLWECSVCHLQFSFWCASYLDGNGTEICSSCDSS